LRALFSKRPRVEKIAWKDAKLRTFITEDSSRDDLVAHVYDSTYQVVKSTDNLVVLDDSIVRGTTLRQSILKMLDRLNPKTIHIVSSAPQIRFPDCYGIDMARLEDLVAFRAALTLHRELELYQKAGFTPPEILARNIVSFNATYLITNSTGIFTNWTQSSTIAMPQVVEIKITAVNNERTMRFGARSASSEWDTFSANTNSPDYLKNTKTFTTRINLNTK
jgi:hypothetical protein